MSKKSSRKALAIALCATVMSGLYVVDARAEQFNNLQVNGENTYFDVNDNNINVSISGGPSIAIKKNTNNINIDAGKSLTTVTKSENDSSTSIKQKENWQDKKQQIEMEARDPGSADSRLVVNNNRIDLDVNDRLTQEGANRVVEAGSAYNPNGMKIWDQVRANDSITTRTQTKDMVGDYVGEMEPTINQHEFIGTGNWASESMTKGYIGSNLVTTEHGISERKQGYVDELPDENGYKTLRIKDTVEQTFKDDKKYKTEHRQDYGSIKDNASASNKTTTSERFQNFGVVASKVEGVKGTESEGLKAQSVVKLDSINEEVRDNDGYSQSVNQSNAIYDTVKDEKDNYTSQQSQKAGKISSTVESNKKDQLFNFSSNISQYDGVIDSKVAINSDKGDSYTEVQQDFYGVTVKDQNTKDAQPGKAGTYITAKDVSIEDGTNRIELSDVGQVDNINADLKKVVGNQKMTTVKAINAETSERIANDIVGGDVSAKGEISLTKGNDEKVAVGTVSDNRLTDVEYAAASGDMTFTVEDKYGNDPQKTITVKDIASKSALDNEVNNREAADKVLQDNIDTEAADRVAADIKLQSNIDTEAATRAEADKVLQTNIDKEAAARQANDIVSGDISAKGDVTLTKGDGSKIDVGVVSDSRLTDARYNAEKGKLIFTVEDKYGNGTEKIKVGDIASKTVLDKEIKDRIDEDVKINGRIDQEIKDRDKADQAEAKARDEADQAEAAARDKADQAEAAARDKADQAEAAARDAADQAEAAARDKADKAEAAARDKADQAEAKARDEADKAEAAVRQANDIVSGDISAKGDVTLTKGDGSKLDVGVVSDSRLTDVDFTATSGEMAFTVEDKYGNGTETIKVTDIASKTVLDNEINNREAADKVLQENIDKEAADRVAADKAEAKARKKADRKERRERIAADKEEATIREANDIVSGDISAKGDVTLTKGDGSKLDVGVVSDSRLTDVDFTATSGEMTFTVEDKYGNGTETIKVSDIASKTVLDNEIKDRVAADEKETAERIAADKKEAAERIAADKKETEERIAADKKEAAERVAADKKEAAERIAADKKEAAERVAADKKEAAERIAADKKEAAERVAADKKEAAERKAADAKETAERIAADKAEAAARQANDIVSGDISAKGDVTLTKGDGSKIDVGVVSDSRLTDVDFTATSGEMTFTVEDKYGNGTETIKVSDIASKTVVENEISQRKEADVVINGRIDQEITDRENADKAEAAARDAADKALNARVDQEILDRDAADQAEAAARDKADKAEAAARDAADKALNARVDQEILDRDAADQAEAAARDKADKAEAAARQANDIVSGDISKKGEVTLTKGNGDKLDVGIVSDNRLTGANFVATSGTLTLTVEDKYGNDVKQTFTVTDIASKTVVENEINQRKEADVIINNRIDQEITDRQGADTVINNRITKLDGKLDKVGAGAAALAALHPMDFDADDKLSFAAGVGNYGGETVTALGAFYRPTEKVMLNAAGTLGSGENMVNMGISFALDKPNNVSNTRVAMAQEILELRAMVAEQGAQIQKLLMINKLTGAEELAAAMFPDVPENHWAYEYVDGLREQGILEGYEDGYFRGDRMMTRYEFAAMLFRALEKGVVLDERLANEFKPELGRIRVDRIKGIDTDTSKVERVRVVSDGNRDDYGYQVD